MTNTRGVNVEFGGSSSCLSSSVSWQRLKKSLDVTQLARRALCSSTIAQKPLRRTRGLCHQTPTEGPQADALT